MSEWKPIESAPRDGTHVLLWGGCFWSESPDSTRENQSRVGKWDSWAHSEKDSEADWGGWVSVTSNPYHDFICATHWMPLPPPPEDE